MHCSVNKTAKFVFILTSVLFILVLSMSNIAFYSAPKKVLGIQSQENVEQEFWNSFLADNPNYVPGWFEIELPEKALSIDPNYENLSN